MNDQTVQRKFGLRDKIGYMFGDFGNDCTFVLASMFLMKFYTDVMGVPGDARAAADNGTLFYPILAGHEVRSWAQLRAEALPRLVEGTYDAAYQEKLLTAFYRNLGSKEK